jgi:hypothetical protein
MDKWDFIKLQSLCTTMKLSLSWRDRPQSGRKYLPAIHQTMDYNHNIHGTQETKLSQNQWTK